MPHAEAFAKNPASVRSIVVEKTMQPHCNLPDHFEHVSRIPLKKQLQLRALRGARQSRRRKRACVRRGIPTYRFLTVSVGWSGRGENDGDGWRRHLITTTFFESIM